MGAPLGQARHHRQDRLGPVQRLHLGPARPRTAPAPARVGPGTAPPTSRTFSMNWGSPNWGSPDSLNPSVRCGLSRNAFQIRPTVDFESPDRLAIDARDQWVAPSGVSSRVATTTASTCSSVIVRGAPGRGSSTSPSSRRATNRDRHLPTVGSDTPRSVATCLFVAPVAHPSTIRQRNANAWALLARRDQRSSVWCSSSVKINGALGRPVLAIRGPYNTSTTNLRRSTLGRVCNVDGTAWYRPGRVAVGRGVVVGWPRPFRVAPRRRCPCPTGGRRSAWS
jgi:hypothetical protein